MSLENCMTLIVEKYLESLIYKENREVLVVPKTQLKCRILNKNKSEEKISSHTYELWYITDNIAS